MLLEISMHLVTEGLITWAGLAWLAWLLQRAEMTFSLVLHQVSQPGWWLMRWTTGDRSELDFGTKKTQAVRYIIAGSCSFQNRHYMLRMIVIAFFPAVGCIIFCIHAATWTFIFVSSIQKEGYWFVGDWLCVEEKFVC